jgi:hypothetical protein
MVSLLEVPLGLWIEGLIGLEAEIQEQFEIPCKKNIKKV